MAKDRLILDGMGAMQTRIEGHLYCAYLLPGIDDFDNGVLIGSITAKTAATNKPLLMKFMALMQEQVSHIVEHASGGAATVMQSEVMDGFEAAKIVNKPGGIDELRRKLTERLDGKKPEPDPVEDLNQAFANFRAGR